MQLRDAACTLKPAIAGAVCHTLVVPADRADAAKGTYTLPVVVLKATGASPAPDAIVVPSGGPVVVLKSAYIPGQGGRVQGIELAKDARARLAFACSNDSGCYAKHPDLDKEIADLIAKADANPIRTSVTLEDGTNVPLAITGSDIGGALFNAQYDETLIPILPSLVSGLLAGDTSVVPEIGRRAIPFVNSVYEAAYYAIDCADNAPLDVAATDPDAPAHAGGDALVAALSPNCKQWDVASVPRSFTELPHAKVPMLALAGSLDPITPPQYTKAAADAAAGPSTFVEFEGNGHGQWNSNDCARSIVTAFLADPTAKPDTSCVKQLTFAFSG